MKADVQTEAAVLAAVNRWLKTYASRDLEALMALFSQRSEVVLIGTGADEKRAGLAEIRAQMERDFAQSESISAELGWCSVSAAGEAAWVAADSYFHVQAGGQAIDLALRLTAVLEWCEGQWLIAQWHVSSPASGQGTGQSW
jgi:ketosteroid isomerase-like protein